MLVSFSVSFFLGKLKLTFSKDSTGFIINGNSFIYISHSSKPINLDKLLYEEFINFLIYGCDEKPNNLCESV